MEASRLSLDPKQQWLRWTTFALVLAGGCAPALDNRQKPDEGTDQDVKLGQGKVRFRNPQMAALYQAAKASPKSFEPVFAYAKGVADASLASLVDKTCDSCEGGAVKYRRRSELEPQYWPIIEDALSMADTLANIPGLSAEQMDALVATKGRLLWLAGRSTEEQTLIDDYVRAHPTAVAVIRRRLELLREDGAGAAVEAQCTRSRAKLQSASEAARLDLLTACVALHPDNTEGRSDLVDYAAYLPNLSEAEAGIYRTHLVQRCVEKVGDEGTRCAEACSCEDKASGKQPNAKCKRTCGGCRNDTGQKLGLCKKLGEVAAAPAPGRAPRQKAAPARSPRPKVAPAPAARPKTAPARNGPKPKGGGSDSELQQAVL